MQVVNKLSLSILFTIIFFATYPTVIKAEEKCDVGIIFGNSPSLFITSVVDGTPAKKRYGVPHGRG